MNLAWSTVPLTPDESDTKPLIDKESRLYYGTGFYLLSAINEAIIYIQLMTA